MKRLLTSAAVTVVALIALVAWASAQLPANLITDLYLAALGGVGAATVIFGTMAFSIWAEQTGRDAPAAQ